MDDIKLTEELRNLRINYELAELDEQSVLPDPYEQFILWYENAKMIKNIEINAMALATASSKGIPSVRMVLLKGFSLNKGFSFFTNFLSNKGENLISNPNAEILFYWQEHERQIRISGKVVKLSDSVSFEYFKTRPNKSKLGAWASPQSKVVQNRKAIIDLFSEVESKFRGSEIPLPPNWGGFILVPSRFEFWQGRSDRLHDRVIYELENLDWKIRRLAP